MNIYQKLIEIRKSVPYLKKEATSGSGSFGYNYTSSSQVLGAVRQKMDEINVLLVTRIVDKRINTREKQNSKGGVAITYELELDLEFTWINADNPDETIVVQWFGAGVDTGDSAKSLGKALTYAEKYFMLKEFNIATDNDDPDFFQGKVDNMVKEFPDESMKTEIVQKAELFGKLRNQPLQAVYKALGVKDIDKLSKAQAGKYIQMLDKWIKQASEQQGA